MSSGNEQKRNSLIALILLRFGRDRSGFTFKRRRKRVPSQYRAFDTRGKSIDAGKYRQLSDIPFHISSGYHFVNPLKCLLNFRFCFAFHVLREQRRRCLRDTTARTDEAGVFDFIAVYHEVELELISA